MAASLQRLGRLRSLKGEPWTVLSNHTVAAFCTKTGEVKPGKKQKPAQITPDLRATLLFNKTRVSFPLRPAGALTSSDCLHDSDIPQVLREAALVDEAPVLAVGSDAPAAGSSSSSSSSSDSDSSDSDSDDDESSVKRQPKVKEEEVKVQELDLDMKGVPGRRPTSSSPSGLAAAGSPGELLDPVHKVHADSPHSSEAAEDTFQQTPSASDGPAEASRAEASAVVSSTHAAGEDQREKAHIKASGELSVDEDLTDISSTKESAGALNTTTSLEASSTEAPLEASMAEALVEPSMSDAPVESSMAEALVEPSMSDAPVEASMAEALVEPSMSDAPVEASIAEALVEASMAEAVVVPSMSDAPVEASMAEALVEASMPEEPAVQAAEEFVDAAPGVAAAEAEKLQQSEGTAAPVEPEEPFDNSSYKNLQHHSYTHYTFADLDLEMAKYRLPQPSSGRPSPRH